MSFSTITISDESTGREETISADNDILAMVIEHASMLSDVYGRSKVINAMMVSVVALQEMDTVPRSESLN